MKGIKIAKIFGISIELHWSWFIVLFLFSWMFATSYFPKLVPKQPEIFYWFAGVLAVLLLFTSVLFHELAHSKVAQLFKIPIKRITLLIIGGAAQIGERTKSAKEEFLVSVVGPISSLVLSGAFWVLGHFLKVSTLTTVLLSYLSFINLVLAIFNLLPGYPLDGGRIFKALLWRIFQNELRATKIAARIGQAFGILMILGGMFKLGLWFVLIGWFLFFAAGQDYKRLVLEKLVCKIKAKEAMVSFPNFMQVDASTAKEEEVCSSEDVLVAVLAKMKIKQCSTLYVVENNKVVGMITAGEIKKHLRYKSTSK